MVLTDLKRLELTERNYFGTEAFILVIARDFQENTSWRILESTPFFVLTSSFRFTT